MFEVTGTPTSLAVGTRRVYLEPLWKLRQEFHSFVAHPPEGFQFVVRETVAEGLLQRLSKFDIAYRILSTGLHWAPLQLLKPWWERFKRLPPDIDLTYAVLHPVFRPEPWLLDMRAEQPNLLVGGEAAFERWKGVLRSLLTSPYCRKIVFETETGRRAFLQRLPWPELASKAAVVPSGLPPRYLTKPLDDSRLRLLFVNSANISASTHFAVHGGLILLEAFLHLRRRYPGLELVVRSSLPRGVKRKFQSVDGLRIIDRVLPWPELEQEFLTADIFVYPTHVTPSMVFLDAMSYELPIVTTDVWANPELVEEGHSGLLVQHRRAAEFTEGDAVHLDSPAFHRVVREVDLRLVQGFVEKVSLLIEQPELRRRLGRAGRQEVEQGRFSLKRHNANLKQVLEKACLPLGLALEGVP